MKLQPWHCILTIGFCADKPTHNMSFTHKPHYEHEKKTSKQTGNGLWQKERNSRKKKLKEKHISMCKTSKAISSSHRQRRNHFI